MAGKNGVRASTVYSSRRSCHLPPLWVHRITTGHSSTSFSSLSHRVIFVSQCFQLLDNANTLSIVFYSCSVYSRRSSCRCCGVEGWGHRPG
eukprot:COSAG01_NODE_1545_length_9958_cov_14.982963_3_plen_91_part_00